MDRRRFLALAVGAVGAAGLGLTGCPAPASDTIVSTGPDRLTFRPRAATKSATRGLQPLELGSERDGLLYVPRSLPAGTSAPLLVLLHGAGGSGAEWFGPWPEHAEAERIVLAAPDSRETTWRMGARGGGRDARFVDRMMASIGDRVSIDPGRVAVAGFSDGASYALLLGLTNGDIFRRVIAFSPGYLYPSPPQGKPPVFVSHGTADTVLPIDQCSRTIVPLLRNAGYPVEYIEFEGGHRVLPEIRDRALRWLAG